MKSISKYVDGHSLAAEVRMERQKHKGSFLLVEGSTDARRLAQCIDEAVCSFVICFGKRNVIEAAEQLHDDGYPGVIGMVDADFDRIGGAPLLRDGIVVSSAHDFDLEMAVSEALRRYLAETCDAAKAREMGGYEKIPQVLMEAIRPLSILRFANDKHHLRYSLEAVDHDEFFDGKQVDIPKMIDAVSYGRFSSAEAKTRLLEFLDRYSQANFDLLQLTSGHDFCAALGLALREQLGERKIQQTWRSEIELHLRLAFSLADMMSTPAYHSIKQWERDNAPFSVFKTH